MIESNKIPQDLLLEKDKLNASFLWIVVAFFPFLFQLPISEVPIWSLGLVLGGWIANKHPLRWIALAWIVASFFPHVHFLLLASSGVLLKNMKDSFFAAAIGYTFSLFYIPAEALNIGIVLLVIGLISIIYQRIG